MQKNMDSSPYLNLLSKSKMVFDYETHNMKYEDKDDLNTKIYHFDKINKTYGNNCLNLELIIYQNFTDNLDFDYKENNSINVYKASFLKRLVSKKKKRYQNEEFDLDLA